MRLFITPMPPMNQYAYKLEGYDDDWIQAGAQRSVTYGTLSPGTYTFHVKAANSDGMWNETGASFSFTILPPWWKTWWVRILLVIAYNCYYCDRSYIRIVHESW